MIVRYTLVGLLAAVMMCPMAGQAAADGGFQILDLKSIQGSYFDASRNSDE